MFAKQTALLTILTFLPILHYDASATPVIQEVLYDAPGPDSPFAFTELIAPPSFNFDGWSLVGINGSSGNPYRVIDLTGAVVPSDGVFVIATSSAIPELATLRDLIANVDWQNGPDAVQLRNTLDEIVDALQYGDAGARNAGEGAPSVTAAPGLSLSRNQQSLDTNNNATDFAESSASAGWVRAETTPVSEPPSLALALAGLVALYRRSHATRGIRSGRIRVLSDNVRVSASSVHT